MLRDRKILYISTLSLFALLLLGLLMPSGGGRIYAAILLPLAAIVFSFLLKKRGIPSYNSRQVLGIMAMIGVFYFALQMIAGVFFGLGHTASYYGNDLLRYVVTYSSIIISVEVIRYVVLSQEKKLANASFYLSSVLAEVMMLEDKIEVERFNELMDFLGITLLPAIVANLLYNYLSSRYGRYPNMAYRLIVSLYPFFFARIPLMSQSLHSLVRLIFPILVFWFVDMLYEKRRRYALVKKSPVTAIISIVSVVLMVGVLMLTSCQFRFGAIVIATDSMTGELNKGDAVVFEQYDGQIIEENDIIVYKRGQSRIVHRVVKIERINHENRYYTKGDTNNDLDEGYVTDANVVGIAKGKLAYVGFPTLWLRELYDKVFGD